MDAATKQLYAMKAEIMQAMAHPTRLAILDVLAAGECCVCDIAEKVGGERTAVSRHLSQMQSAGLLSSRKDGLMVIYSLKTPCVLKFLSCVTDVIRRNHEATAHLLQKH